MTLTSFLPFCVALLQAGAAGVYLYHGSYRLAIIWAGVSVANFALAGMEIGNFTYGRNSLP